MKKVLVFLLGFFVFSHIALSQYLLVYEVDKSNYPTIGAKFLALDDASKQITNISKSDFKIYENGVARKVLDISCPAKKEPAIISSVLVMDESGSMNGGNNAMAKIAAKLWINSTANVKSECAIVGFSDHNRLIQDFTTDRTLLLSKANDIHFGGGTNYNAALIEKSAGGLVISDRSKYKPVIVFLSDGASNFPPQSDLIIKEAKRQGVAIHVVTIAMPCPDDMKDVAEQTGGLWFEYINSEPDMKNAYQTILQVAQSVEPCTVEWETDGCDYKRACTAELVNRDVDCHFSYFKVQVELPHLEQTPSMSSIKFGGIQPNTTATKTLTITARIEPITINDIVSGNTAFKVLDYGGSKPPFTLGVNESRKLTIEFAPLDSTYKICKFIISSNACAGTNFYCVGGFWGNFDNKEPTIRLTHPNGGEKFLGASDTLITWEGCAPDDSVNIEFSSDASSNWETIITDATNFSAAWNKLPSINSENCLIRATLQNQSLANISNKARNIKTLRGSKGEIFSLSWCENEKQIVSGGIFNQAGEIKVWDIETEQEEAHLFDETKSVFDVTWSPNGKWIAVAGNGLKVYDVAADALIFNIPAINQLNIDCMGIGWHPYKNLIATHGQDNGNVSGKIDIWDVTTGQKTMSTLNGTGHGMETEIIWSPDANRILMANMGRDLRVFDGNTGAMLTEIDNTNYSNSFHLSTISWSHDGSKFAQILDFENAINIHNSQDGTILNTIALEASHCYAQAWSPDGRLIAYGGTNKFIYLWDTESKMVVDTLIGHEGAITTLEWSKTGQYLASASTDQTVKIWRMGAYSKFSDVSDSLFSIVMPEIKTEEIDMGDVFVATAKDSVVKTFLKNPGACKNRIDSIHISGGDADQFACITNNFPIEIQAGKQKAVEFRFRPTSIGFKQSEITVLSFAGTTRQKIYGNGVQNQLESINKIIDFGLVSVGDKKDTIQAVTITNIGNIALDITDIKIGTQNNSLFSIINNISSLVLNPGDTCKMDLRFTPSDAGRVSGTLEFTYDGFGSPEIIQLFGEGFSSGAQNQLEIINKIIDFGLVRVGDKKDTIQALTIRNISNTPVDITDIKIGVQNNSIFSIINNISSLILNAGDTCKMDLRFTPINVGRVSGTLEFTYAGDSLAVVQLFGEGFSYDVDSLILRIDTVSSYDNKIIHIPITLNPIENIEWSGITAISVDLQYNSTLLFPNYKYKRTVITPTIGQITLSDLPLDQAKGNVLTTVMFKTGLGNAEGCDLVLLNPVITGNSDVNLILEDGYFSLLGVCHEGGTRLFSDSKMASGIHAIRPNPASNYISIEIGIIEKGYTEVAIYDVLGKKIRTIFAEEVGNLGELGERTISADVSDIANGQYMLLFTSPTYIGQKAVMVWK